MLHYGTGRLLLFTTPYLRRYSTFTNASMFQPFHGCSVVFHIVYRVQNSIKNSKLFCYIVIEIAKKSRFSSKSYWSGERIRIRKDPSISTDPDPDPSGQKGTDPDPDPRNPDSGSRNRLEMISESWGLVFSFILDHRFLMPKKVQTENGGINLILLCKPMLGREIDLKWFQNPSVLRHRLVLIKKCSKPKMIKFLELSAVKQMLGRKVDWKLFQNTPT